MRGLSRQGCCDLLVAAACLTSEAFAGFLSPDEECVTSEYTMSPEGLSALQVDIDPGAAASLTYESHPSSVSRDILISVSADGLTGAAIAVGVEETTEAGVKTISIPGLHQFQEETAQDADVVGSSSTGLKGLLLLPVLCGAFLYLHKRSGRQGVLVSAAFLGLGGVLALCPAGGKTTMAVSVPDTYCMLPRPPGTVQLKDCSSAPQKFPIVDTHTHAWENCYKFSDTDQDLSACPPTPGKKARYIPAGVLPFPQLQEKWYSQNITYGVLVQPSFMGVNNTYIVQQLEKYPRLRGVIMVTNADGTLNTDAVEPSLLESMHEAGVRGIRLNLLKKPEDDMARLNAAMNAETGEQGFRELWAFIKQHDWHVEAQQDSEGWVHLIDTLVGTGCRVIVDHFSRPDPALNLEDPGWKAVLAAAEGNPNIYMKITGTYRLGVGPDIQAKMAHSAKEKFGIERLLWGSDFPHTGCSGPDVRHCEDSQDYWKLLQTVFDWFPAEEDQEKVLYSNGAKVFGFP